MILEKVKHRVILTDEKNKTKLTDMNDLDETVMLQK